MKNRSKIEQQVEDTLKVLDEIEPAETDQYFFSRVQSRLENREEMAAVPEPEWNFGFNLAVACMLLVVSLNLMSLAQLNDSSATSENSREELMEEFAQDFMVLDLQYVDELNDEE